MREYFTGHAVANAIRMKRSLFSGAFLVVEGVTDERIYGLALDRKACSTEIAYGRDNALGALRILNAAGFSGAIGIVDADFGSITGEVIQEDNILQTDGHDLECMLLNSPALDRLLEEFGTDARVSAFAKTGLSIALQLATSVVPLGCLRLISIQEGLNLKFEGLTFSKFVEPSNAQIDLTKMVHEVVNKSQEHQLDQTQLLEQLENELQQGHDCWQISCGHDILELLSFAFRKTFSAKQASEVTTEILGRSLRLAYGLSYFKETKLYRALSDWEESHPNFTLLDST